jgi:hypothetical protein
MLGARRARQVKVRHEDGELKGLEEWVVSNSLLCPWGERKAFLRDERAECALRQASESTRDRVEEEAISAILTATGEETGFIRTWSLPPDRANRLWNRAGLTDDPVQAAHSYLDRFGVLHLSYETSLRFAQAFAAREPEPCLLYIEEWENRLRAEGYEPGNRHAHAVLREFAPAHALIRQWAASSDVERLQKEVERLHAVVGLAVQQLEAVGADAAAKRVKRALRGS